MRPYIHKFNLATRKQLSIRWCATVLSFRAVQNFVGRHGGVRPHACLGPKPVKCEFAQGKCSRRKP